MLSRNVSNVGKKKHNKGLCSDTMTNEPPSGEQLIITLPLASLSHLPSPYLATSSENGLMLAFRKFFKQD